MKKVIQFVIALVALAALIQACSKYPGFKKDKTGLYYKFHITNKKEPKPENGDLVELTYNLRTNDSVLVENYQIFDMINESLFPGDVYDALRKMHLGDSATFIMNGDTFFHYFMGKSFPYEKKEIYFDIKLIGITPGEEYERKQAEQARQYEAMIEEYRDAEDSLINNYIVKNNIKVKPTENGLYFIRSYSGKGKPIVNGTRVKVHYTGKFLDGEVFDSSFERGVPVEVIAGSGQFIAGWEEALKLMKGGDKATVLIPSKLAYGSRGYGYVIQPYTPLVFEMEVVSVE